MRTVLPEMSTITKTVQISDPISTQKLIQLKKANIVMLNKRAKAINNVQVSKIRYSGFEDEGRHTAEPQVQRGTEPTPDITV